MFNVHFSAEFTNFLHFSSILKHKRLMSFITTHPLMQHLNRSGAASLSVTGMELYIHTHTDTFFLFKRRSKHTGYSIRLRLSLCESDVIHLSAAADPPEPYMYMERTWSGGRWRRSGWWNTDPRSVFSNATNPDLHMRRRTRQFCRWTWDEFQILFILFFCYKGDFFFKEFMKYSIKKKLKR